MCTMAALGVAVRQGAVPRGAHAVAAASRSGSCSRRCCAAPTRCCCSTSRTTTWTCPASAGWRSGWARRRKTVLFVSHDRELLAGRPRRSSASSPARPGPTCGCTAAVSRHSTRRATSGSSGSRSCAAAGTRSTPSSRSWSLDMQQYAARSDEMASRYAAAQTRLRKFEEAGPPPEPPRKQEITMRLRGGRTGVRAITCEGLELTGLMQPFDLEVFYGERVAVLGSNGSGKSHFLRLLAGRGRGAHRRLEARRPRRARPLRADPRPPRAGWAGRWSTSCGPTHARDRGAAMSVAAPLRTGTPGRPALRQALGRPAGPVPDPAARTGRRDRAAARRADRQPRPGVRRGACRRAWRPTRARCSRSLTTAGSRAPSTASSSSAPTARSARRRAGLGRGRRRSAPAEAPRPRGRGAGQQLAQQPSPGAVSVGAGGGLAPRGPGVAAGRRAERETQAPDAASVSRCSTASRRWASRTKSRPPSPWATGAVFMARRGQGPARGGLGGFRSA